MSANRMETRSSIGRLALIGAVVVGMAMCTNGVGKVAASGQWLSLPGVAGSLLGLMALVIVGARLMGKELPPVSSNGDAIKSVVAIALAKFAIALVFLGA